MIFSIKFCLTCHNGALVTRLRLSFLTEQRSYVFFLKEFGSEKTQGIQLDPDLLLVYVCTIVPPLALVQPSGLREGRDLR